VHRSTTKHGIIAPTSAGGHSVWSVSPALSGTFATPYGILQYFSLITKGHNETLNDPCIGLDTCSTTQV